MIKTVLAYDIVPGVDEDTYNDWIVNVHGPDLLANPYVERLVFNTVLRPITKTSGSDGVVDNKFVPYRVGEIHFKDEEAYENSLKWFAENPIADERSPKGRTQFIFYVVTNETVITRENLSEANPEDLRAPRQTS